MKVRGSSEVVDVGGARVWTYEQITESMMGESESLIRFAKQAEEAGCSKSASCFERYALQNFFSWRSLCKGYIARKDYYRFCLLLDTLVLDPVSESCYLRPQDREIAA